MESESRHRRTFSVRRLMIAVSAVAVLMGMGIGLRRRHDRFQAIFTEHSDPRCQVFRYSGPDWMLEPTYQRHKVRAAWHATMCEKYRRATRFPFLPVRSDPREPK